MKISFDAKAPKSDAYIAFATEGGKLLDGAQWADKKTGGALRRAMAAEKFEGKRAQTLVLSGPDGLPYRHIVIVGLGKPDDLKAQDLEKVGGTVVSLLNTRKAETAELALAGVRAGDVDENEAAVRVALGALLSSYRFDKYLTKEPQDKKPTVKALAFTVPQPQKAHKFFDEADTLVDAVYLTRDLVSETPNHLYPASFAEIIRSELVPLGVRVKTLGMKEIQKLGMGALEAVGQGSAREPKLVTMEYYGGSKKDKTICFVGKGVTFDTGGISLKPGAGMEDMKWDMAGAAAVTGLMYALAARGARVNVVGVVALAENMPSGNACRPSDIVTSMSGQTIEILNTDAEGRLILCDALWYAQEEFQPTHIVDLATLTGAVIIALGHEYAGLFSNDDDLAQQLADAGNSVGEELWRLPLNDAWDKAIDSPAADIKNISGGRDAGSAIGAHFLKRFIQPGVKWAHLDIAGVAWNAKDRTSAPKGASAFGVRLLDRFVAENFE
ncbi:MAG TPA: leucyl aminopeptidase [Patescibacteria group bacterium]|nr:leucyl aminopeptidase [Patescibacteria group bacterium]